MDLATAKELLAGDVIALEEIARALGADLEQIPSLAREMAQQVPFAPEALKRARQRRDLLVFRLDTDGRAPLTIARIVELFPAVFDQRLLNKVGYLLRDQWGILREPLAHSLTCEAGWALVPRDLLPSSRNLSFYDQEPLLAAAREDTDANLALRRRTAAEAVYDLALCQLVRGERLLRDRFDWTSSVTMDGGFLTVGRDGEDGIQIVAFSPAVRNAKLGVCPTRLPAR